MAKISLIILSILLIFSQIPGALAEEMTEAKKKDISKLLLIIEARSTRFRIAEALNRFMIRELRMAQKGKQIPDRAYEILREVIMTITEERIEALEQEMISIYGKYLTHEDIGKLLKFYESDIGKKTIAVLPKIGKDSAIAGRKWGQNLVPFISERVEKRTKEEGIEFPEEKKEEPSKKSE